MFFPLVETFDYKKEYEKLLRQKRFKIEKYKTLYKDFAKDELLKMMENKEKYEDSLIEAVEELIVEEHTKTRPR